MSERIARVFATIAFSMLWASQAISQEPVARLHSSDWNERAAAFASIFDRKPGFRSPSLASELLDLFKREDGIVTSAVRSHASVTERYGEAFGEYYAEVVDACVSYCAKDGFLRVVLADAEPGSPVRSSAIELLANVFDRGFSQMQQERMIDAFIAGVLDSTTITNRYAGILVLATLVSSPRSFTAARKEQMHQALVSGTSDRYPALRIEAVRALAKFRDPRDRALFTRIAAEDPAVRTEAVAALARLPR